MKSLYQTVLVVLMGSLIASACVPNRPPSMVPRKLEGSPSFIPTADGCASISEEEEASNFHKRNMHPEKIAYSPDGRWVLTTHDVPYVNEVHLYDRLNNTKILVKHPNNNVFLEDFAFDLTSSKLSFSASFQYYGRALAEIIVLDLEEGDFSRIGKMGEGLSQPIVLEGGAVVYLEAAIRKGASLWELAGVSPLYFYVVLDQPGEEKQYLSKRKNRGWRFVEERTHLKYPTTVSADRLIPISNENNTLALVFSDASRRGGERIPSGSGEYYVLEFGRGANGFEFVWEKQTIPFADISKGTAAKEQGYSNKLSDEMLAPIQSEVQQQETICLESSIFQ